MVQLSKTRLIAKLSAAQLKKKRDFFKKNRFVRFSDILDPEFKKYILKSLHEGEFVTVHPPRVGMELQMKENVMDHALLFAQNDPELFKLLHKITGCGLLRSYTGRLYRFAAAGVHYDTWHDDTMEERSLAISINLSEKSYQGGVLLIRDKKTKKIISRVKNTGFGDAIVFKVSRRLEHCLTPLRGKTPKTAYAGWFSRQTNGFFDQKGRPA